MNQKLCSGRFNEGAAWMMQGFSLIEMMIALVVLAFGLLSAGQMLFIAASSGSLARSKGTAAIAAQDRLEFLADLYRQNPQSSDLALGYHSPMQSEIWNPLGSVVLNRFQIEWTVSHVPDARPGKLLDAKLVEVTVAPSLSAGIINSKPGLNKILNVSTILSPKTR